MPHKRAKRSAREQKRSQEGANLAPSQLSLNNEPIPKSVARVLNAAHVQQEWKKKRKEPDSGTSGGDGSNKRARKEADQELAGGTRAMKKANMRIQPGESLMHFNRRVEDSMRSLVREAMHTSSALGRKVKKGEEQTAQKPALKQKHAKPTQEDTFSDDEDASTDRHGRKVSDPPKEFATLSTSVPRRVNDIVQAPPQLKKLPRGAQKRAPSVTSEKKATTLHEGVLSMAQKAMLEEERERAIRLYREMKKR